MAGGDSAQWLHGPCGATSYPARSAASPTSDSSSLLTEPGSSAARSASLDGLGASYMLVRL